jgi:serine/threonine-protein kinase
MDQLKQAGFEPGTALPEIVWGIFTVSSTSPAAPQLPGTKITVRSTG